jgi:hypothetical protein
MRPPIALPVHRAAEAQLRHHSLKLLTAVLATAVGSVEHRVLRLARPPHSAVGAENDRCDPGWASAGGGDATGASGGGEWLGGAAPPPDPTPSPSATRRIEASLLRTFIR